MSFGKHEVCVRRLMRGTSYTILAGIAFIFLQVLAHGFSALSWEFLTELPRSSGAEGGIFPALLGTFYLVFGALVIALPLGVAGAIFLSEYAGGSRLTEWIRMGIITLAGVPSIVFGLFGFGLFVIACEFGISLLSGSLTLACMILPTIIVSSEEALRSIPVGFREGSLALGATKWQTISRNVLPYAFPGILTGSILGVSRAAGETAPILLTAAAFYLSSLPKSIFDQVMALPYHLYILATQHPDIAAVRPRAYATALVLLVLVLGMNSIAIFLRKHFRKKHRW